MANYHKLDCLVKRLDYFVVVKVTVTVNVHPDDISSTAEPFVNHTWYGDATSWTRVSGKMFALLFSRSRSQLGVL